jgi:hypothetical protein
MGFLKNQNQEMKELNPQKHPPLVPQMFLDEQAFQ